MTPSQCFCFGFQQNIVFLVHIFFFPFVFFSDVTLFWVDDHSRWLGVSWVSGGYITAGYATSKSVFDEVRVASGTQNVKKKENNKTKSEEQVYCFCIE